MKLRTNTTCLLLLLSIYFTNSFGQGTHSSRFNFLDYNGGLENWDICSVGKNIAVANQQGLMLYRNGSWQTNSVKNSIAPRTLYYLNNKLYTAFGNTIGFFNIKNDTLSGVFHPILLPVEIKNFSFVWKIVSDGKSLYYQTNQHIIHIKEDKVIKVHPFSGFIRCIFEVNKDIYFVDNELGLLKNFSPVMNGTSIAGKEINVVLPFKNGDLLISDNSEKKFLRYNGTSFTTIWTDKIMTYYPFCGIKSDNNFIIGTIKNGFYYVSENGEIQKNINATNFMSHNKVFNLHKDANDFLWVSLENGIERFRFDLPYSNIDFESLHGNPENVENIDSTTFFITTFGFFELNNKELFHPNSIKHIRNWNNTTGPSFFIKKINNSLVYGNFSGTFSLEKGKKVTLLDVPYCSEIVIANDNYFFVKGNREWYLFSSLSNEIRFVRKIKLPSEFQTIEGKIVWSFGKSVFEKDFDLEMNFGATKAYKVKENIERLFVKNDTLFMTNCLGTFFISSSKNNNLISTKYDERHIYEFDNQTTHLEYNYLLRPVFFDSNFPNKKQLSHFVNSVLVVNKDKLKFIKQINDSLICLGT